MPAKEMNVPSNRPQGPVMSCARGSKQVLGERPARSAGMSSQTSRANVPSVPSEGQSQAGNKALEHPSRSSQNLSESGDHASEGHPSPCSAAPLSGTAQAHSTQRKDLPTRPTRPTVQSSVPPVRPTLSTAQSTAPAAQSSTAEAQHVSVGTSQPAKQKHRMPPVPTSETQSGFVLPNVMNVAFSEDEEDQVPSSATLAKRRTKQKKRPAAKVSQDASDEEIEGAGEDRSKGKTTPAECRLSFYKGKTLALLKIALTYMRLYVLTCNAFPTQGKLRKNAKRFFMAACHRVFGSSWKSEL